MNLTQSGLRSISNTDSGRPVSGSFQSIPEVMSEQVLQRDRFLPVIEVGDAAVGKQIQHAMIGAIQQTILDGERRQRADHRLGGRIDDVGNVRGIRRVIGIEDDPAVPHDQEAVEADRGAEVDQPGERRRVHALLFRRGRLPSRGRPDRLCAALRKGSAADRRHEQDQTGDRTSTTNRTRPHGHNPAKWKTALQRSQDCSGIFVDLKQPRNGASASGTARDGCAQCITGRKFREDDQ